MNGSGVADPASPGATVSALACGTAFTFEVDASDAAGNRSTRARITASTAACGDSQPPTAPANVVASSRTATSIALTWSAATDNVGVTGYGLYRAGTLVGSSPTTSGLFTGLSCNTNYTLSVDAYDAAANRSQKTTVLVSTTACVDSTPPSAPTGFAASNVSTTGLTLTWNAATDNVGVSGYDVFRNGTKMASVSSTTSAPERAHLWHLLLVRPRGARCRRQPLHPRQRQRHDRELRPAASTRFRRPDHDHPGWHVHG